MPQGCASPRSATAAAADRPLSRASVSGTICRLRREADVVVNCLPMTPDTEDLFDAELFAAMRPTAFFINVGRGGTVDTDALVAALVTGRNRRCRARCHRPRASARRPSALGGAEPHHHAPLRRLVERRFETSGGSSSARTCGALWPAKSCCPWSIRGRLLTQAVLSPLSCHSDRANEVSERRIRLGLEGPNSLTWPREIPPLRSGGPSVGMTVSRRGKALILSNRRHISDRLGNHYRSWRWPSPTRGRPTLMYHSAILVTSRICADRRRQHPGRHPCSRWRLIEIEGGWTTRFTGISVAAAQRSLGWQAYDFTKRRLEGQTVAMFTWTTDNTAATIVRDDSEAARSQPIHVRRRAFPPISQPFCSKRASPGWMREHLPEHLRTLRRDRANSSRERGWDLGRLTPELSLEHGDEVLRRLFQGLWIGRVRGVLGHAPGKDINLVLGVHHLVDLERDPRRRSSAGFAARITPSSRFDDSTTYVQAFQSELDPLPDAVWVLKELRGHGAGGFFSDAQRPGDRCHHRGHRHHRTCVATSSNLRKASSRSISYPTLIRP